LKRRQFIVELPEYIETLKEHLDLVNDIHNRRQSFFEEWGSSNFIGAGNQLEISGLDDPRLLEPARKLPNGWKKMPRFPGYVQPSSVETKKQLKDLEIPLETKVAALIATEIADLSEKNTARMGSRIFVPSHGRIEWLAQHEDNMYMFVITMSYFSHTNIWVAIIPDPELEFETLTGLREIKEWEFLKLLDEHREAAK
jgi:hypothetical protein